MLKRLNAVLAGLGHRVIDGIWRVGAAARLFSKFGFIYSKA